MSLFVRQDEKRSQLQEKLAADLKGKLKTNDVQLEKPESTILEDAHETRNAGVVIAVLIVIIIITTIVWMFLLS